MWALVGMLRTMPIEATDEELAVELAKQLKRGMPVDPTTAGDVLPELRCCYGRARNPRDRLSRIAALNLILDEIFEGLGDSTAADAVRLLFRVDASVANLNLTERQQRAASTMGYEVNHFRKRVRPRLVAIVARALAEYDVQYRPRTEGRPPPVILTGERPEVTPEHTAEEELLSRIWSYVYGLRAELTAAGRIKDDPAAGDHFRHAVEGAVWQGARLMAAVAEYLDRYGEVMMEGDAPYATEGVMRLAGWRLGWMTEDDAQWLRYALNRVGTESRAAFIRRVRRSKRGQRLLEAMEKWV